ncbi:MAG: hypothetical protein ABSH47_01435 [Bryobacteraceae bacterium]
MTRNDFMKCCTAGMCSCGAVAFLPQQTAQAESANPEMEGLKWRLDFAQRRFARLVQILDENVDEPVRKKIWETQGRDHAREYRDLTDKYKGNLEGFLKDIQGKWVEKAEYDAAKGTIRIVDKSPTCTCPLVRQNLTPPSFCDCTLGWQKEAYSAVVGRPVEATLEESILRGGKRCVFRIQIL